MLETLPCPRPAENQVVAVVAGRRGEEGGPLQVEQESCPDGGIQDCFSGDLEPLLRKEKGLISLVFISSLGET